MLIGKISLTQTHLILKDVDGSEVGLPLDDAMEIYQFVKDHLQEIEELRVANWHAFLNSEGKPDEGYSALNPDNAPETAGHPTNTTNQPTSKAISNTAEQPKRTIKKYD